MLFFPGGEVKYAQDGHITEEVKYMGGLVGGGLMVSSLFLKGVALHHNKKVLRYVKWKAERTGFWLVWGGHVMVLMPFDEVDCLPVHPDTLQTQR